jgi:YHS domain-containing protein/putative intracellular protease/amidase
MNRREWLQRSAVFGFGAAMPFAAVKLYSGRTAAKAESSRDRNLPPDRPNPLHPPAQGAIPVAFVVSRGAVVIDFAGPWEVFQDVHSAEGVGFFNLYTVAETTNPVTASAGLKIVPDYTFQTAPAPRVIVIPAQNGESPAMLDWIRSSAKNADVTMSVCTGAYVLAQTGLLAGKAATTHHSAYKEFATKFPDIQLKRGARFVEVGNLASAGGLSSGIDLALRVVERYFGRARAGETADMMEYQGQGWLDPDSNSAYRMPAVSTDEHPLCPVCEMDGNTSLKSVYKGKTYYFCSQEHKQRFDEAPDKFVSAARSPGVMFQG